MPDIVITATVAGVPTNGLTDDPEVRIVRSDTGAIEQAFIAMTDLGVDGKYSFPFVPTVTLDYAYLVDADPNVTGQVSPGERFFEGAFPGNIDILADTGDLVNLDAPVSSRATQADILSDATPFPGANVDVAISTRNSVVPMDAATSQLEHDATQTGIAANLAAIGALNDISIADVQTALDNQGYTAARALLLDNLDGSISSVIAAIGALNDISVADILSAVLGSGNTVDAELSAILALRDFIEGGRDIDFTGNDALGWQRIERNVAGTLIRRYNLFDETGSRINETVASFIGRQGMISAEVAI